MEVGVGEVPACISQLLRRVIAGQDEASAEALPPTTESNLEQSKGSLALSLLQHTLKLFQWSQRRQSFALLVLC